MIETGMTTEQRKMLDEIEKLKGEVTGLLHFVKGLAHRAGVRDPEAFHDGVMQQHDCSWGDTQGVKHCTPATTCTVHQRDEFRDLLSQMRLTHKSCWQDEEDDNRCAACVRIDEITEPWNRLFGMFKP